MALQATFPLSRNSWTHATHLNAPEADSKFKQVPETGTMMHRAREWIFSAPADPGWSEVLALWQDGVTAPLILILVAENDSMKNCVCFRLSEI